jgi:hypothetical protein
MRQSFEQRQREWEAEKKRAEELRPELEERYDFELVEAECEVDGCDRDASYDPGPELDDLQHRCDEHHRLNIAFWMIPGDHPSVPARGNVFECGECGDEFVLPFGIYAIRDLPHCSRRPRTEHRCLDCADREFIEEYATQWQLEGFDDE